ncbi:MAG: hypothetical protein AAF495_01535 [Pseudomonadota bacterium]
MIKKPKLLLCFFGATLRTTTVSLVALTGLSACEGLRLHDAGRLQTATEAKTLAEEFGKEGVVIFEPLEQRADSVSGLSEKVIDLAVQHELETFENVLADRTWKDVDFELYDTMSDWQKNLKLFDEAERQAVQAVNDALQRREVVNLVLTTSVAEEQIRKNALDGKLGKLEPQLQTLKDDLNSQGKNCNEHDECNELNLEIAGLSKGLEDTTERIALLEGALPPGERGEPSSLIGTIETLKSRSKWMDKSLQTFLKAFDKASGLEKKEDLSTDAEDVIGEVGGGVDQAEARLKTFFETANTALDEIDTDEHVVAARALFAVTVKNQLDLEQARIGEYRRYLGAIRRLRETFDTREIVAVCELFLPAVGRVWLRDDDDHDPLDPLVELYNEFAFDFRYKGSNVRGTNSDEYGCQLLPVLPRYNEVHEFTAFTRVDLSNVESKEAMEIVKTQMIGAINKDNQEDPCDVKPIHEGSTLQIICNDYEGSSPAAKDWENGKATLAKYMATNVKRPPDEAQGAYTLAAMGILSFVERPFLDIAVNRLYEERNRHALRLSKINTQQRTALLTELAAGIEIHEQGGLKPEEISELVLFAAQVGALFFIGFQQ